MLTKKDFEEMNVINSRIESHKDSINRYRAEIESDRARLEYYQNKCGHANGYQTSCMGDLGFHCPDCGYSR